MTPPLPAALPWVIGICLFVIPSDSVMGQVAPFDASWLLRNVSAIGSSLGGESYSVEFDNDRNGCIDAEDLFIGTAQWESPPQATPVIHSLDNQASMPGSLLVLSGEGFDPGSETSVTFFDDHGFQVTVPAVEIQSNSVTVPTPVFIDLITGDFAAGVVSVQVVQRPKGFPRFSNVIENFQILNLPFPAALAGVTTLSFLTAQRAAAEEFRGLLEDSELRDSMSIQIGSLDHLIAEIGGIVKGTKGSFGLGSISGVPIVIDSSHLLQMDRLIMGMLQAQSSTSKTPSGCQTQEAASLQATIASESQPNPSLHTGYYGASRTSISCKTAEAVETAFKVVAGSAAIGVGLLTLAGAPAIALALPTAALLYVTIASSGGTIAIGASLGQATEGAVQLIQGGVRRIESSMRSLLLGKILPKTAGIALNLFTGSSDLVQAFTSSSLSPAPTPTPTQTTGPTPTPTRSGGGNLTGTWKGEYDLTIDVSAFCPNITTLTHSGMLTVNLNHQGNTLTGTGTVTGVKDVGVDGSFNCVVINVLSFDGAVTGTVNGSDLEATLDFGDPNLFIPSVSTFGEVDGMEITGTIQGGGGSGSFSLMKQ